jgi:hypothetical protein
LAFNHHRIIFEDTCCDGGKVDSSRDGFRFTVMDAAKRCDERWKDYDGVLRKRVRGEHLKTGM